MTNQFSKQIKSLLQVFEGELYTDPLHRTLYATDASAYREVPLAVAIPRTPADLEALVALANDQGVPLIPRGAGTSLAGQVVGSGLVVDLSKYFNRVLHIDPVRRQVRIEPGVVLAELNRQLKAHGLLFGPETSTANRCTLGGMLGNNGCGLHSLVYGSVRDHVVETEVLLSDGSRVVFSDLDAAAFNAKCELPTLEGRLYRHINTLLGDPGRRAELAVAYPDPSVPRRNHGYALDILAAMQPFDPQGPPFNFSKLLAGSEGTLALVTAITLELELLPPPCKALLCVHFDTLGEAYRANLIGLKYHPSAIELMDKTIIDLTRQNIGLARNRFFIKGEPGAVLIIELWADHNETIEATAAAIEADMRAAGCGYHFPLVWGSDIPRVWALRTAGLGVLSNMPGDAKPVSVTEDTAVPVDQLAGFLADYDRLMDSMGLQAVHHAHIATGELHLRPVLNLKDPADVVRFRTVATETARLVKRYRGSLSGEHGDGRLRGEFIPFMYGQTIYGWLRELKATWDPRGLLNPGKITDTPALDTSLRYEPGRPSPEVETVFDFSADQGFLRAIEKCNGSADCRKSELAGGTLCPSFMATRDELHSTRGRANILRELTGRPGTLHWADQSDILEALDLCLSCKACKAECPSGLDMARLKAEFLQHHYDGNPVPLGVRLVAHYPQLMNLLALWPAAGNALLQGRLTGALARRLAGFTPRRPFPRLAPQTLSRWMKRHRPAGQGPKGRVYLFNDEFLNSTDTAIGIKAVGLLERLGYEVVIPRHVQSGRTLLSKGQVRQARRVALRNVLLLADIVGADTPLVGIEPSAILTFRDEYPDLVPAALRDKARALARQALMIDEFLVREAGRGSIGPEQFTTAPAVIRLHGHCHQKALATTAASVQMLSLPQNYVVHEIPSGCCGMAGAFGYEQKHYELSMQVGELVLFPAVRAAAPDELIVAPGTSCREQIAQGTGRRALHPVEVLFGALR